MTEDPVKLYVVVMAILLCVLGFVALTSHAEAAAYEDAINRANTYDKKMKEYAAEVKALCGQLSGSRLTRGFTSLIEEAANDNGVKFSRLYEGKSVRLGNKGKERRWVVKVTQSSTSRPLTRETIARFCQAVERYSQGILKTIEIRLSRVTGPNTPSPGREDKVINDLYRGDLIFGLRVVD